MIASDKICRILKANAESLRLPIVVYLAYPAACDPPYLAICLRKVLMCLMNEKLVPKFLRYL